MQAKTYPKINVEKIKNDAQELYQKSENSCAKAIVLAIKNNVDPAMPEGIVKAAAAFAGGVGRSQCMCGTVSGGALCLGYFFGRLTPTTPTDPKSLKSLALAHELQDTFRKNHKVLCCNAHAKIAEKEGIKQKDQCTAFVGEMAAKTAEIIARELGL